MGDRGHIREPPPGGSEMKTLSPPCWRTAQFSKNNFETACSV